MRAALMTGLSLLACQIGRRQYGLNSLALVAALMALFNPQVLWDIGFQLSFAATPGLVLYGGSSQRALASMVGRVLPPAAALRLAGLGRVYFLFTLAAGDRCGLPSPKMLEAVRDYTLLRTDVNGWIELTTEGEQVILSIFADRPVTRSHPLFPLNQIIGYCVGGH